MTRHRKVTLWLALCLSLPAAAYAGLSFFFYVWLEASKQWAPDRAARWAYGSLALAVLFGAIFAYCVVSLIREANRAYQIERDAA